MTTLYSLVNDFSSDLLSTLEKSLTCKVNTLVVFDSRVRDLDILYKALLPDTSAFTITAQEDVLNVITQLLTETGAKKLAIVAHGESGVVHIGANSLNIEQIEQRSHLLQEWGVSEIALYSCEVAKGDRGQAFLDQLGKVTGAVVSGSTSLVGNAGLGGNWHLHVSTSLMERRSVFCPDLLLRYEATLADGRNINNSGLIDSLDNSLTSVHNILRGLSQDTDRFYSVFGQAFGSDFNITLAENIRTQWASGDFRQIPAIQVLGSGMNGALGAYAISNNTIYLSESLLASSPEQIEAVMLEEIGHYVDAQVNVSDTVGDEGELFAAQVLGVELSDTDILAIKSQNDLGLINVNDQSIEIEAHASFFSNYSPYVSITSLPSIFEGGTSYMQSYAYDQDWYYEAYHYYDSWGFYQHGGYSSYPIYGSITSYQWFVDSSYVSSSSSVYYSANRSGSYSVQLTVRDNENTSSSAYGTLFVTNVAPSSLSFSATSSSVNERSSATFNISFYDPGYENNHTAYIDHDGDGTYSAYSLGAGGAGYRSAFLASSTYSTPGNYQARAYVQDSDGGQSSVQTIDITVNDVNEAPSITSVSTGSVNENTAISTVVYDANATDPDPTAPNNTLVYSLSGTDASLLTIDSDDGEVRLNAFANFEAKSSYGFNVVVTDGGNLSNTKAVTITVNDVNEAPTAAALTNTVTTLAENTVIGGGIKVADISITDDALGTETLTLTGSDAASFEIRGGTQLFYIGASPNFEVKSSFAVNVVVDDTTVGITPDFTLPFTLNITDVDEFDVSTPIDTNAALNAIAENAAIGSIVGITANATDADASNNTVTYTLTDNADGRFAIDANSGVVTVADGTLLDFEAATSQSIIVQASSSDGSISTQSFAIAVTDVNEAPTAAALINTVPTLAENTSIGGGFRVADISITDDALGSETLSLTGADAASFAIVGTQLFYIGDSSDFEVKSSFAVNVVVDDTNLGGNPEFTLPFILNITDVNEAPVLSNVSLTISEGGTVVLNGSNFSITEPDNTAFNYTASGVTGGSFQTFDGSVWTNATTFNSTQVTDGSVRFIHDGNEAAPTFQIQANDGEAINNLSSTINGTVTFTNVNDAPVIDLDSSAAGNGFATTFTEDDNAVSIVSPTLSLTDVDSSQVNSAQVRITNLQDAEAEILSVNTTGTAITATYYANVGILELSGFDSVANYQQVLQSVTYNNTSQNPTAGDRSIQFSVNDSMENSNQAFSTVTVIPVNDDPVLDATAIPTLSAITEDTLNASGNTVAEIVVDGSITDVDVAGVAPEAIAISAVDNTNGIWQYQLSGGNWTALNFSGANAGKALLLDSTARLRFIPNADYNGTATFSFRAWDQTVGSSGSYFVTSAEAGALDTSFGTNGIAYADFTNGLDIANAIATQSDGKVIIAGYSQAANSYRNSSFARFNSNGTLDTTFGKGGKAIVDLAPNAGDQIGKIHVLGDGSLLATGSVQGSSSFSFALAKITASGSLDTSFGSNGKVVTNLGNNSFIYDSAVLSDGKVIAVGELQNAGFAIVRYNSDGSLDTSFSSDGIATVSLGSAFDSARSVTATADGKSLVAGF